MYSIFTNIYLLDGDRIFFLHRAADKAVWPDALLGVGGKIEPGEELYAAAVREFQEEAGATPTDLQLIGTLSWLDEDDQNGINYIFVATKYDGNLFTACDEGTFEWIDIRDAMVDSRTAVHQLRYLPYLVNGEHFSQHMHFQGAFSDGNITKDFNSVSYTNHRMAKNVKTIGIATSDPEKLAFITTILSPYKVTVVQDDQGASIDMAVHTADAAPDSHGSGDAKAALEYTVRRGETSSTVFVPAQRAAGLAQDDDIWHFLRFTVGDEAKDFADLSDGEKTGAFGLLAQAIMKS